MKTREEVETLKKDWLDDPCYDLYDVEEFADYYDELYLFQLETEKAWLEKDLHEADQKYRHFIEVCHDIFGINKRTNTIAESLLKDRGY